MFGFYELQLPSQLAIVSTQACEWQARRYVAQVLPSWACCQPSLSGPVSHHHWPETLLYISQTGDAVLGGLVLFAMGLGMGVPLLVIGTSEGKIITENRCLGWKPSSTSLVS